MNRELTPHVSIHQAVYLGDRRLREYMDVSSPIRVKQIKEYHGRFAYPDVNLAERLERTRSVNLTKAQLSVLFRFEMLKFTEFVIERIYPVLELLCRQTEKG
jgi:hypothetical protein